MATNLVPEIIEKEIGASAGFPESWRLTDKHG